MVQVQALSLLTRLTSLHAASKRAALAAGAGPVVVEVVASAFAFPSTGSASGPARQMQRRRQQGELAVTTLNNLVVSDDERLCAQLEAQGGIRAALAALSADPAGVNVQKSGLGFLDKLLEAAKEDDDPGAMQRRVRTVEGGGGVRVALAALRAHAASADVQVGAVCLIDHLCCHTAVRCYPFPLERFEIACHETERARAALQLGLLSCL